MVTLTKDPIGSMILLM